MELKRLGPVAIIVDERLSPEKAKLFQRAITVMRTRYRIETYKGDISEDELLAKIGSARVPLILAPWYRYLAWNKIEALYGATRTSGPAFAGYFADSVKPYELEPRGDALRLVLLDFANLKLNETLTLVDSLLAPEARSGILPLMETRAAVYCEEWFAGRPLGPLLDGLALIPDLAESTFSARLPAIRLAVSALWSVVFEEGPGKADFARPLTKSSKGALQLAVAPNCAVLRLVYSLPSRTAREVFQAFWNAEASPSSPCRLLLQHADFLRVHPIADTSEVEVVAGFFASAPAELAPADVRSVWIEPLAASLFQEPWRPQPEHRSFPQVSQRIPATGASTSADPDLLRRLKEQIAAEAGARIRDLLKLMAEKDELINELKAGGVGTSAALEPPDAEALLEAFQARYFDARFQIRKFELEIERAVKEQKKPEDLDVLRAGMDTLRQRQELWVAQISKILEKR